LSENNSVFLELHNRIAIYQFERRLIQCRVPIAEEPTDADLAVQPDASFTATGTECPQQTAAKNIVSKTEKRDSSTYRWSDFDSDEELPDITDFLPRRSRSTQNFGGVEPPQMVFHVGHELGLQEALPESSGSTVFSKQPPAAGGKSVNSKEEKKTCVSLGLPVIPEESEDDQEDVLKANAETAGNDNNSTYSSPLLITPRIERRCEF